ncbi:MAG: ATP-binding protein [Granulosicoccus sp.]
MRSITSRLVIGTSLFVAVFIVLLALSISYSVHTRAEAARFDALKGVVYGILGATDIDNNAQLTVNSASLPDDNLNDFNATLYAELIANDRSVLWKSNSAVKPLPDTSIRPINDWMFEKVTGEDDIDLLRVQYVLAWELDNGEELPFIVHVAENVEDLSSQLQRFDRVLWMALLAVAPILPIVQFLMLRVSLKPLRDIGSQIDEIEQGERDALSDTVPIELAPLTSSLNTLLQTERERHAQYKNLLGDLSHNLKTPLSVLQNIAGKSGDDGQAILQQTQQMKNTLEHYAQRATARTPRYLSPTLQIRPFIHRISSSLNKLYDTPSVQFTINVDEQLTVRMDEADLLEVLGNLLENACKYGARHISVNQTPEPLSVSIEDDGPGWPEGDLSQLIQRGIRADTRTSGQGIGLAASDQIMRSYGGTLELSRANSGGAQVLLHFS